MVWKPLSKRAAYEPRQNKIKEKTSEEVETLTYSIESQLIKVTRMRELEKSPYLLKLTDKNLIATG